ncbi:response regulator transcription factor [Rubrivirga sp. IMCC43871]|uniref:response regulator n=1 Tax=Rubrivirga sp. IMCC43871 TaxID=3391575 RepID=UPI0039900272
MPTPPVRVLLADDSDLLRSLLRDAIDEVEGVEVVAEAADGAQAVVGVGQHRPGVVVLDLQMPVMNGLAALKALRQARAAARVIMLTNHADDLYREACLQAGADHFLDKSAGVEHVLDILREWAQTGDA